MTLEPPGQPRVRQELLEPLELEVLQVDPPVNQVVEEIPEQLDIPDQPEVLDPVTLDSPDVKDPWEPQDRMD